MAGLGGILQAEVSRGVPHLTGVEAKVSLLSNLDLQYTAHNHLGLAGSPGGCVLWVKAEVERGPIFAPEQSPGGSVTPLVRLVPGQHGCTVQSHKGTQGLPHLRLPPTG